MDAGHSSIIGESFSSVLIQLHKDHIAEQNLRNCYFETFYRAIETEFGALARQELYIA